MAARIENPLDSDHAATYRILRTHFGSHQQVMNKLRHDVTVCEETIGRLFQELRASLMERERALLDSARSLGESLQSVSNGEESNEDLLRSDKEIIDLPIIFFQSKHRQLVQSIHSYGACNVIASPDLMAHLDPTIQTAIQQPSPHVDDSVLENAALLHSAHIAELLARMEPVEETSFYDSCEPSVSEFQGGSDIESGSVAATGPDLEAGSNAVTGIEGSNTANGPELEPDSASVNGFEPMQSSPPTRRWSVPVPDIIVTADEAPSAIPVPNVIVTSDEQFELHDEEEKEPLAVLPDIALLDNGGLLDNDGNAAPDDILFSDNDDDSSNPFLSPTSGSRSHSELPPVQEEEEELDPWGDGHDAAGHRIASSGVSAVHDTSHRAVTVSSDEGLDSKASPPASPPVSRPPPPREAPPPATPEPALPPQTPPQTPPPPTSDLHGAASGDGDAESLDGSESDCAPPPPPCAPPPTTACPPVPASDHRSIQTLLCFIINASIHLI